MLFKMKTVVLLAMIVVVAVGAIHLSGRTVVAAPPETLIVADEDVAVGQVLDVGELVGDTCVMTYEAVEVQVDVSVDEPKAGISLYINEDCELIVANKYRSIGPRISVFGGSSASSSNRYTATAKSWWRDFADLELAATTVIFTYQEISNGFEFVGLTRQYCTGAAGQSMKTCFALPMPSCSPHQRLIFHDQLIFT